MTKDKFYENHDYDFTQFSLPVKIKMIDEVNLHPVAVRINPIASPDGIPKTVLVTKDNIDISQSQGTIEGSGRGVAIEIFFESENGEEWKFVIDFHKGDSFFRCGIPIPHYKNDKDSPKTIWRD